MANEKISFRPSDEDMVYINKLLPKYENSITKLLKTAIASLENNEIAESIKLDAEELGYEKPSTMIGDAIRLLKKRVQGKLIPSYKVTKDEIAAHLGISPLSKEWSTFMEKIEKVYYEHAPRNPGI